jgi:hypothetical protein
MNTKLHHAIIGALLLGGCSLADNDTIELDGIDALDDNEDTGPLGEPAAEVAIADNGADPYVGAPIIPDECIGASVVGIVNNPEGSCNIPELPGEWAWRPMFEDGSPEVAALGLAVPAEFDKYCMYEWVSQEPLLDDGQYSSLIAAIDAYPFIDLDSVAADCLGFEEQGDLNDPSVAASLEDSFQINIDAVDALDLAATEGIRRPVRMALLDSISQAAFDQQLQPHNEHGLYMGALIGDIACPSGDPSCVAQLRYLLAMPRTDYQLPDWTVGLDYASKVDVAIQIYAAVQQWREAKLSGDPDAADRLVINLSLGYHRINAGVDEFDRGPQASLKTALDFAACHGALVFAASGNVRDENCPNNESGPLAPASFEALAAPTEAQCAALGFTPDWAGEFPVFPPSNQPRPLVYAVGGVDAYDNFLVNGINGSRPMLAALGANGIGSDMSMALTGSSVSTAVASATAMLMWSYDPSLRPDEIHARMYDSGHPLGEYADFGIIGAGEEIRRLSVCASLDQVCQGLPANKCPQLGCVAQPSASDGNLGGFFTAIDGVLSDPSTKIEEFGGDSVAPTCDATPMTELVTPQPEAPICGHCAASITAGTTPDDDVVTMTIDTSYQGEIFDTKLLIEDATGMVTAVTFDPYVIDALNNPNIDVVKVYFDGPDTVAASLAFTLNDGTTQANPIPVR